MLFPLHKFLTGKKTFSAEVTIHPIDIKGFSVKLLPEKGCRKNHLEGAGKRVPEKEGVSGTGSKNGYRKR
jgi:hypothetical protein